MSRITRNEMPLHATNTLEEAPAPRAEIGLRAASLPDSLTTNNPLPLSLKRDSIQLLLQSPNKLFLYWSFATDPHATLRAAFGELAVHYRLAVRLVKVESGEEFVLDAPKERMQWFEVYPRHVYRADVGFHAESRPFVRLLSSNELSTPPDRASEVSAEEQEFQVKAEEYVRLLSGAGYERYAQGLTGEPDGNISGQHDPDDSVETLTPQAASAHVSREDANEYPHR